MVTENKDGGRDEIGNLINIFREVTREDLFCYVFTFRRRVIIIAHS